MLLICFKSAFSQLNDSFTDGNLGAQPEWRGDLSGFNINNNKQLQTAPNTSAQTIYLATASSLTMNAKWEFYVQLGFDPSANNQVRIYLISDNENLRGPLSGYFIQIGESGNSDSYDLYKQSGTVITQLINGPAKVRANTNLLIARVQVTRTINGLWEVKTDITGGVNFMSEGIATDISINSSAWFGVHCKYTTSNSDKFIFDDFQAEIFITDVLPPKLLSITVKDSVSFEAFFDEPLDSISAKIPGNYLLNKGYNNPLSVSTTANPSVYKLKFQDAFFTGNYQLTVNNLKDQNNNHIAGSNIASFSYIKPYLAAKYDLVINEIFADPSPQIDLPSVEFVELFNNTTKTISLKNWKYSDAITTTTFPTDSIASGQYLILSAKADTNEYKRFGKVIGISPWPSLNNAIDNLKLISPEGKTIDSISYSDTWYRNTVKKQGGWTLERQDPTCRCEGRFNWGSSIDSTGGTPGKQNSIFRTGYDKLPLMADSISQLSDSTLLVHFNKHIDGSTISINKWILQPSTGNFSSVIFDPDYLQATLKYSAKFSKSTIYSLRVFDIRDCTGNSIKTQNLSFTTADPTILPAVPPVRADTAKIFISEIFADPSPEQGLPLVEFVEIYNPGRDTIDINGWTLNDLGAKSSIKSAKIAPKEYLILCPIADTLQYKSFGKVAGLSPWPSLNNASDHVVLKSFKNRTSDSVAYSDAWYKDPIKKQGGWSLERVQFSVLNQGFYSWNASKNDIGGTPGKTNSDSTSISLALLVDSVSITSDSTLRVTLNMVPDTASIKASFFDLGLAGKSIKAKFRGNYSQIDLTFKNRFEQDKLYTLTIDSLWSVIGIKIDPNKNQKSVLIPSLPEAEYKVLINEIFADASPVIGLPEAEFIELHNPTDAAVNLNGMSYEDASGIKYIFKKGQVDARGYLILCAEKDTLNFKPFGNVMGIAPWPSLNNDEDVLILKNNKGKEFNTVPYNNLWYRDKEKQQGGWSLELIDPQAICSGTQNWAGSLTTAGGTPGGQNSVYKKYSANDLLKLTSVLLIDSINLKLNFNRPVDSLSASIAQNFQLNNGAGSAAGALPIGPNFESIVLRFNSSIARGNTYRLSINDVTDCAGTVISVPLNQIEFFYPSIIAKNDLIINEILFNPRTGGVDFVEIYNRSNKVLNLEELGIATLNEKDNLISLKHLSTTQLLMQPNQYLAISTDPDIIKKEYRTEDPKAFLKLASLPLFNDDAGVVALISRGLHIDQLNYSAKMHFPLIKNQEGVSLERSSFDKPANESGNFRSATASAGYATPGYRNSQYDDIKIPIKGEIVLSSKSFSPDQDGFEDVLLLNYNFSEPGLIVNASVYDTRGKLIRKLIKNETLSAQGVITWDGLNEDTELSPVGVYVIHLESFNLNGEVKKYRRNLVLAAKLD